MNKKNLLLCASLITVFSYTNSNAKEQTTETLNLQIKLNDTIKQEQNKKTVKKTTTIKKKIKKKNHGFSGQFSFKGALGSSNKSLGASIKWKPDPKDYSYFKVGVKHDLSDPSDGLTYSWGVGYDDWHEGTWTVQVNHWGGIKPGEGFDSYNAAGSIGYKVKSDFLKKNKLKSGLTLSKQLGGDSEFKASASLGWSPAQYWTIKGILVQSLHGGSPTWNYVIGYDDWHPNTFGFEYSNYGGNALSETTFTKNGKLSLSYKWAW